MKSVLEGFIGTYSSRYSDLRGYWLNGQLNFETSEYHVDLLAIPTDADTAEAVTQRLAIRRFEEQLANSGLDAASVQFAHLKICMHSETVEGWQGNHRSAGHMVDFVATAVMDNGRSFERKRTVFVAPHDSRKKFRRLPEDRGT